MKHPLYPKRHSEFEAHAELYSKLKAWGLNVRGEVRAPKSRFDLAIFDRAGDALLVVIEVKKSERVRRCTKLTRYEETTGVPVLLCQGFAGVDDSAWAALQICRQRDPQSA